MRLKRCAEKNAEVLLVKTGVLIAQAYGSGQAMIFVCAFFRHSAGPGPG
jgi:hypothetical protein